MARGMTTVVPGGRRLLVVMMALLLAMAGLLPGWGAGVARAAACVGASPLNSGPGRLRSAMNNIDGFSGCTDIPIAFSIDGPVDIFLSSALPVVGGHLSITGPGASLLTIHG